jgi:hypothetical protein
MSWNFQGAGEAGALAMELGSKGWSEVESGIRKAHVGIAARLAAIPVNR